MIYLNVDALQQESEKMRGSERIKIGVDTGAEKTAWLQNIPYGTTIPGDSDLSHFPHSNWRTCQRWQTNACCGLRRLEIESQSSRCQAPVCKPLLSVGEYTTMGGVTVLHGDKGYMFHKGSNVAKNIDSWIQKELRDSQYRGCTVAYKENNEYNIYMKPKGNKTDAMPLSESSGGSWPGPNL